MATSGGTTGGGIVGWGLQGGGGGLPEATGVCAELKGETHDLSQTIYRITSITFPIH